MSRSRGPNYGYDYNYGGYATEYVPEQYDLTDWTNYYVTTQAGAGHRRRPVIYVAAPMPAISPLGGGFNGFSPFTPMGGPLHSRRRRF